MRAFSAAVALGISAFVLAGAGSCGTTRNIAVIEATPENAARLIDPLSGGERVLLENLLPEEIGNRELDLGEIDLSSEERLRQIPVRKVWIINGESEPIYLRINGFGSDGRIRLEYTGPLQPSYSNYAPVPPGGYVEAEIRPARLDTITLGSFDLEHHIEHDPTHVGPVNQVTTPLHFTGAFVHKDCPEGSDAGSCAGMTQNLAFARVDLRNVDSVRATQFSQPLRPGQGAPAVRLEGFEVTEGAGAIDVDRYEGNPLYCLEGREVRWENPCLLPVVLHPDATKVVTRTDYSEEGSNLIESAYTELRIAQRVPERNGPDLDHLPMLDSLDGLLQIQDTQPVTGAIHAANRRLVCRADGIRWDCETHTPPDALGLWDRGFDFAGFWMDAERDYFLYRRFDYDRSDWSLALDGLKLMVRTRATGASEQRDVRLREAREGYSTMRGGSVGFDETLPDGFTATARQYCAEGYTTHCEGAGWGERRCSTSCVGPVIPEARMTFGWDGDAQAYLPILYQPST